MTKFSDLGITSKVETFIGKKISPRKIIDKDIKIFSYKIKPSKYPEKGNGKCLCLQIEYESEKRIVFTGSVFLMDLIEQVPLGKFPLYTKIIEDNERYVFS
jgi:hypothetical protein